MGKSQLNIYLLALGAFVTGTAELVVAGIIRQLADELQVSVGAAGQLITAYSVAFAVGAPLIVSTTARAKRKTLLVAALLGFALGNALACVAPGFAPALAARAVIGASAGVFSVVAFSAAAKLAPPERTGRAVGALALGVSVSTVIGVPLGAQWTEWWGWRSIFAALGLVALLVALLIGRLMPHVEGDATVPFTRQFAVLRSPVIAFGLFASACFSAGFSLMNSYLVPFAEDVLRLHTGYAGTLLLLLGASGLLGSRTGGVGVDRWGAGRVVGAGLALAALAVLAVPLVAQWQAAGIALFAVWTCAMSAAIPAILTAFIRHAPQSANLLLGLNTSALHLGVALGASAGGAVAFYASTLRYHPAMSGLLAVISLGAAWLQARLGKTRRNEADRLAGGTIRH